MYKKVGGRKQSKSNRFASFFCKQKKAQLTVFIVIGIVIVIIAAFLFFLSMRRTEMNDGDALLLLEDKQSVIRQYVESCMERQLINALEFVSLQGGYVYKPQLGLVKENYNIAYDYYLGVNLMPTFEEIEDEEISVYIKDNLPKCLQDSEILNKQDISLGVLNIDTEISDEYVLVNADYPLTLTIGDKQEIINDFSVKKDISLGLLLDTASDIIDHTVEDPNWIDIGYLESLGLDVEVIHIDEKTIVYRLKDPEIKFKGVDSSFMFAALFKDNSPPDLFSFPTQTVRLGQTLELQPYALDFDEDELTFSSDSTLLSIDSITGLITFKPDFTGTYDFNIKVADDNGFTDSELLKVVVI